MKTNTILVPYQGREKYKSNTSGSTVTGGIKYMTNTSSGSEEKKLLYQPSITVATPYSYKIGTLMYDGSAINLYGKDNISEGVPEWYNIQVKRYTKGASVENQNKLFTVIENYDEKLKDDMQYRFVLLNWKNHVGEGNRWRIPMFSPRWSNVDAPANDDNVGREQTPCAIAWEDTWWSVLGSNTLWWNYSKHTWQQALFPKWGGTRDETNSPFRVRTGTSIYVWKKGNNRKLRFGACLMKKTGAGTYGWQRVSNVVPVTIFIPSHLSDTNPASNLMIEPNKM